MTARARPFVLLSALLLLGALGLVPLLAGCGGSLGQSPSGDGTSDAGLEAEAGELVPPPISRTMTEGQLAPQRRACAFDAGAWPAQTIGTDYPVGADIPINHVMVIMQENRSFDHYLGRLVAQGYYKGGDFSSVAGGDAGGEAGAGSGSGFSHSDELDGPPAGWSNPDGDGGVVVPHPDDEYCFGVDHGWQSMHGKYDDGRLDCFVTEQNADDIAAHVAPDGQRTFFYEDDTVIPFYYALANTFALGDRYYCSVLSSTWPNRLFLMAATSFGIGDNSFVTLDTAEHPVAQLFSLLDQAGRSWKDYTDGPHQVAFFGHYGIQRSTVTHYGSVECTLFQDIRAGTLPDVSLVMGDEVEGEFSDEGPSDLPGIGGGLVESIIRALFASPSWKDTAVFIVYDENGGLADHVPPAPACRPDGYPPHDVNDNPLSGAFDTTGFRVPFMVVSPYARAHFVSHTVFDHTSLTRFIEARFGLPALTARDANATPPFELFDFQHPPFMTPPNITAHTTAPPAIVAQCNQSLPPTCGN